jgi:hypothetical protein
LVNPQVGSPRDQGARHKFLGSYVGPFKVLEKKLSDTYKLEL